MRQSGYLRGLHELGLLKDIRYVTGVSGSSWALVSYLYRQKFLDDSVFLGKHKTPEEVSRHGSITDGLYYILRRFIG